MSDCQIGLDLCCPLEDYKDDECFSLLWCTLTRVCMEMKEYEKASEFCDMGLSLVGDNLEFSRDVLNNYKGNLAEIREEAPNDYANVAIRPVGNSRDKLKFVYTTKVLKPKFPDQPELLAVDLDISAPYTDIFSFIIPDKIREWSHQGLESLERCNVFKVPESNYWVTAIPVWSKEDREVIASRLMTQCVGHFKIVVLKVDQGEEPPVEVDAEMYIKSIVKNAHKCEIYYRKNKKLVEV